MNDPDDPCACCNHARRQHTEERGGRCGYRKWDRVDFRWIYCDCKAFNENEEENENDDTET